MKKIIDGTTIRFLVVGVVNTIIGTGTMFLLYNVFGVGYWIASASNYVIGSIVSYFLNKYFTFKNREKSIGIILKFIINISVCYIMAYGLAKPFVYVILDSANAGEKLQDNIAMLVGMCLFVALNYLGQRFVVFNRKGRNKESVKD